jgi:hypothetical protein
VLDQLLAALGESRPLAEVSGEELAGLLKQLWGQCPPATWNRNRGTVAAWLSWCTANRLPGPIVPASAERRREHINSKGGDTEWICWGSGTAHLLPRLIRAPQSGPVFLSERRPGPARRPATQDLCPATGRARLGYDRARILFTWHTGWQLHQLRHSAATHLGEQRIPLQLIMAKTRYRNPRTAMRYVRPGAEAVAEITGLLEPPRRRG